MARILVVDADPAVRGFVRRALRRGGHETVEAADSTTALRILRARLFDAVICDPEPDGEDNLRLLHDIRHTFPGLGVVVMGEAALPTQRDRLTRAILLGAHQLLEKPLDSPRVLGAVKNALIWGEHLWVPATLHAVGVCG